MEATRVKLGRREFVIYKLRCSVCGKVFPSGGSRGVTCGQQSCQKMRPYVRRHSKKRPEWRLHPSRIMLLELERLARLPSSLESLPFKSPCYPKALYEKHQVKLRAYRRKRYHILKIMRKELEHLAFQEGI